MTHRVGNLRVIAPPPSTTPSPTPSPTLPNPHPSSPRQPPPAITTASHTTPTAHSCHTLPPATSPPVSSALSDSTHAPDLTSLPAKPREIPLGKNLRWTAVALAAKLSAEHERPSAAVADEIALSASKDLQRTNPERDAAAVERNTRRRVYDALKVMVAAGCIQREGKALRWIGVEDLRPGGPLKDKCPEPARLRVTICESRRRLSRKRAMQRELENRIAAFERLVKRRADEAAAGLSPPPGCIHFPMVVVKAVDPQVSYSSDRKRMRVSTPDKFCIYTESDLVVMLTERRRSRGQAPSKKPRVTKKSRPSPMLKTGSRYDVVSPVSPPPPPPPSPMLTNSNTLAPLKAPPVPRQAQQCLIDLKKLNVVRKTKDEEQLLPVANDTGVGDTRDYAMPDSAKAELCLDAEMPVRYEQEDDDKYFEDLRKRNMLPANVFIHGLNPHGEDSGNNSTSTTNMAATEFDRLPGRPLSKERFEQEVSLICDEELSDPIPVEDDSTDNELLIAIAS